MTETLFFQESALPLNFAPLLVGTWALSYLCAHCPPFAPAASTARVCFPHSAPCPLCSPYVWEFSRLNLQYVMLSKRNILKLVRGAAVRLPG